MKKVTLVGIELTVPAFIVLIGGLAVTLVESLILANLLSRSIKSAPRLLFLTLLNIILLLLVVALNVYIINCLSVGGCDVLAVIFTSLYLIAVIASILSVAAGRKGGRGGSRKSTRALV
jgi:hypothetical protein